MSSEVLDTHKSKKHPNMLKNNNAIAKPEQQQFTQHQSMQPQQQQFPQHQTMQPQQQFRQPQQHQSMQPQLFTQPQQHQSTQSQQFTQPQNPRFTQPSASANPSMMMHYPKSNIENQVQMNQTKTAKVVKKRKSFPDLVSF